MGESASLLRFLASKILELNCFYPTDLIQRQKVDAALDYNASFFRDGMIKQFGAVLLVDRLGKKEMTPGLINLYKTGKNSITFVLKNLEAKLKRNGTTFICGNEPSIADFQIYCELEDAKFVNRSIDMFPHLVAYAKACKTIPGLKDISEEFDKVVPQLQKKIIQPKL